MIRSMPRNRDMVSRQSSRYRDLRRTVTRPAELCRNRATPGFRARILYLVEQQPGGFVTDLIGLLSDYGNRHSEEIDHRDVVKAYDRNIVENA